MPFGIERHNTSGSAVTLFSYNPQFAEWVLSADAEAGETLTLPISFTAGKEKLVLTCNGLTLGSSSYTYSGESGDTVNEVTVLFPLQAGYELTARTISI